MAALRWIPLEKLGDLEALISSEIKHGSWAQARDALAVTLGLHGMRVGEVCRAQLSELYLAGRKLHVPKFKRGNARTVDLHQSTIDRLQDWRMSIHVPHLLHTRKGAPVHPTQFRRAARRLIAQAIGEPLKFHSLRHTFAMRLYDRTRDLFLVQEKLGHRSVKSTEVYARSLAEVPDDVLIQLDRGELVSPGEHQLKLFVAGAS